MATEIDACKIVPKDQKAYDHGLTIGHRVAGDGDVSGGWTALAQYTQKLFEQLPAGTSFAGKQKIWADQQNDVVAGMSCADPKDFKYVVGDTPGDKPQLWQHADIQNQANSVLDMFDRFNVHPRHDHSAEPAQNLDTIISQANAHLHNRIEPLGLEAMKAFAADFNERRATMLNIKDASLKAEVIDNGRRVVIRKEVN
jgi:hypothetical protein